MRLIWWAALGVGAYYLLKKKPEEAMVSYSDAQKLGLIKSVSDVVIYSGIADVTMVVNKDGSLTFIGKQPSPTIPTELNTVVIGTFASPDAVNEWIKSQTKTSIKV